MVFRSGTNIAGQHLIKEVAGGGRLILTKMGKRGNWQDPENMQVGPTRRKNSRAQVGLCQERERKRKNLKNPPHGLHMEVLKVWHAPVPLPLSQSTDLLLQ